jgi:hypothetical protein
MSHCDRACGTPTPAQAHCPTCHRTFGGVTGFDAHRSHGKCRNPLTMGYVERDRVWRRPSDLVADGWLGRVRKMGR